MLLCSIKGCTKYRQKARGKFCQLHYGRQYRAKHPEHRIRDNKRNLDRLRRERYGLSPEQYEALFVEQGKRCAICKTAKPKGKIRNTWHIDHVHGTKIVRGILCPHCNTGLGMFADNVQTLYRAIFYLIRSSV
jgi:hypothetical protein